MGQPPFCIGVYKIDRKEASGGRLGAHDLLDRRNQNAALRLGNDLPDADRCGFLFEIS